MHRLKWLNWSTALVALALFANARAHAQVIVIANASVKAAEVSKGSLKEVFTGAAGSLKDGSHVTPVVLKSGAPADEFLSAYVGMSSREFTLAWRNLVFSGQATTPKSFDTEAAMVEYVAHTPGAIGYIGKATPHDGVKVLAVK